MVLISGAAPRRSEDRASTLPAPSAPSCGSRAACRRGRWQATPAHCRGSRSSSLQHIEDASQRSGIDARIDPHAPTAAKTDLDQHRSTRFDLPQPAFPVVEVGDSVDASAFSKTTMMNCASDALVNGLEPLACLAGRAERRAGPGRTGQLLAQ
jgi:hypothetical protein